MTVDLFSKVRSDVVQILRDKNPNLPADLETRIEVSPSKDPKFGDMASNAAMVVARYLRQQPQSISASISASLITLPGYAGAEPAGPGFINIRVAAERFRSVLPDILRAGTTYGDSAIGNGTRINVEYISANPTGPMHIGHCRGAVVGDALANLLIKSGHAVTKEYYINDAGAQVTALAWAAYWRYLQAIGTAMTEEEFSEAVPGGLQYRGEYLIPIGESLSETYGASLAQPDLDIAAPELWLDTVRDFTIHAMMREI